MKGYLVYSYDTQPYNDIPDYPVVVFLDEQRAIEYVAEQNLAAEYEKEEWESIPNSLYDYQEIGVI
jgi:heat shock protein HspQ